MSNLTHLFKPTQKVRVFLDGSFFSGTVTETQEDHIIVDVPSISDHCYFDNDMIGVVYPEYNFATVKGGAC